jgi:thiopurine S-methyltransferase
MNTDHWLESWKQNKIGFHQHEINGYLSSFWKQLNLEGQSRVFVPLCGKSLDLLWLRQQGHHVLGIEISAIAIRDFFVENKLSFNHRQQNDLQIWEADQLTILQDDFFNLTANQLLEVEGVFDRAALVALPIQLRQKYVQHLKNILSKKASILLIAFEYDQSKMEGPPFAVHEAEIHELYGDSYEIKLLLNQEALDHYPSFRSRGLNCLAEKVYLLTPIVKKLSYQLDGAV